MVSIYGMTILNVCVPEEHHRTMILSREVRIPIFYKVQGPAGSSYILQEILSLVASNFL